MARTDVVGTQIDIEIIFLFNYDYNYTAIKNKNKDLNEEIIQKALHPKRMLRLMAEYGEDGVFPCLPPESEDIFGN